MKLLTGGLVALAVALSGCGGGGEASKAEPTVTVTATPTERATTWVESERCRETVPPALDAIESALLAGDRHEMNDHAERVVELVPQVEDCSESVTAPLNRAISKLRTAMGDTGGMYLMSGGAKDRQRARKALEQARMALAESRVY